jgi:hypothetical protein
MHVPEHDEPICAVCGADADMFTGGRHICDDCDSEQERYGVKLDTPPIRGAVDPEHTEGDVRWWRSKCAEAERQRDYWKALAKSWGDAKDRLEAERGAVSDERAELERTITVLRRQVAADAAALEEAGHLQSAESARAALLATGRGAVSPELVRDLGSAWRADDGAAIALAIARLENAAGLSEQGDPPPAVGAVSPAASDEERHDG